MEHWTLDDICWNDFDESLVDSNIVTVVKAASMVEYHSEDYGDYLCSVFSEDQSFCQAARQWAKEEVQHGKALKRYAEMADPDFDFDSTFARFIKNHQIKTDDQINSRLISIENSLDTQKLVQNFLLRKKYLKLINLQNIN